MKFRESAMRVVFLLTACLSIAAVLLICLFLFSGGLPAIAKIGVREFLLVWNGRRGRISTAFSR